MTTIKNNIILLTLSALAMLSIASCSETLDDINISPNTLPDTEVDIKFVLTGILSNTATLNSELAYEGGELSAATQYLQRDFTSYEENNYQWAPKGFGSFYEPLKDAQYIFERAENEKPMRLKTIIKQ